MWSQINLTFCFCCILFEFVSPVLEGSLMIFLLSYLHISMLLYCPSISVETGSCIVVNKLTNRIGFNPQTVILPFFFFLLRTKTLLFGLKAGLTLQPEVGNIHVYG